MQGELTALRAATAAAAEAQWTTTEQIATLKKQLEAARAGAVGPGGYCSPRHRMPLTRHTGAKCVSMMRRATSARPYGVGTISSRNLAVEQAAIEAEEKLTAAATDSKVLRDALVTLQSDVRCFMAAAAAAQAVGPARCARHVIGCRFSQETRFQIALVDVAGNTCEALGSGAGRRAVCARGPGGGGDAPGRRRRVAPGAAAAHRGPAVGGGWQGGRRGGGAPGHVPRASRDDCRLRGKPIHSKPPYYQSEPHISF